MWPAVDLLQTAEHEGYFCQRDQIFSENGQFQEGFKLLSGCDGLALEAICDIKGALASVARASGH